MAVLYIIFSVSFLERSVLSLRYNWNRLQTIHRRELGYVFMTDTTKHDQISNTEFDSPNILLTANTTTVTRTNFMSNSKIESSSFIQKVLNYSADNFNRNMANIPSVVPILSSNWSQLEIVRNEVIGIKLRVDKLEKAVSTGLTPVKAKSTIDSFIDSLSANTISMNAKTVEICAVISFFFIGSLVGASLLDRLWLLG